MHTFRSDNNAGLTPEALAAIVDISDGSHDIGYGDDQVTAEAVAAFRGLFGDETSVWFVATGTAANTLAVAALTEPWEQVVCHRHSHYNDDESTAPERLTHCRTCSIATDASKLTPADIEGAVGHRGDVHQPQPGVVTVSNVTEFGTVYAPREIRAICETAHGLGYRVHVDGARFANAVAALGCDPRALGPEAGVDALSFGGTKNGLAFGEAVLFFPQGDRSAWTRATRTFPFHRKGSGHLISKHRYLAGPLARTISNGSWLRHAARANAMAARLGRGLAGMGLEPAFPVEANAVFVSLPAAVDAALQAAGHGYYPFGDPAWKLVRLMCSFDATEDEVDAFLADARAAARI